MKDKIYLPTLFIALFFVLCSMVLHSDVSHATIDDAIDWLSANQTALGAWTPGESAGSYSYALRALVHAGRNDHMVREIYQKIRNMQSPNGSWSNSLNNTALCIWALLEAGENPHSSVITKGISWLKYRQYPDGHWGETHATVATSLGCIALAYAGENDSLEFQKGIEWLRTYQNSDGYWGVEPVGTSSISVNMYPMYALYLADPGHTSTQKAMNWFKSYGPNESVWYLITSMGLAYVGEASVLPTRLNQMISAQQADGGWGDKVTWPTEIGRTSFGIIALGLAKELGFDHYSSMNKALTWMENHYDEGVLSGEYERVGVTGNVVGALALCVDPGAAVIENAIQLYKKVGTGWAGSFFPRPPYEYNTSHTGTTVWALRQTGRADVLTIISESIDKLLNEQNADGGWGHDHDNPASAVGTTLYALWGLIAGGYYTGEDIEVINAVDYITANSPSGLLNTTEYNAIYAWLLHQANYSTDTVHGLREHLYYTQNPDGGWGATAGDPFSALTPTALSLITLNDCETLYGESLVRGRRWLEAHQNPDGSWSEIPADGPFNKTTNGTAHALRALVVTEDISTTPRLSLTLNKSRYLPGDSLKITVTCDGEVDGLYGGVVLPSGELRFLTFSEGGAGGVYNGTLSIDGTTTPGGLSVAIVADFLDGAFDAGVKTVEVDSPFQTDFIGDTFDENERWVECGAPAFYNLPQFIEIPGNIGLQAGQLNTFGYWTSYDAIINAIPGSLYRAHYTIHSTATDPALVPQFRVRLNRDDYQISSCNVVSSTGDGANSPTGDATDYDIYFVPFQGPAVDENDVAGIIASFDLMHFEEADDLNTTIYLDELEIERIPLHFIDHEFAPVTTYTFETDEEGWTTEYSAEFDKPDFVYMGGRLVLQAHNSTNTFGYWWSPTIAVEEDRIYRLRCKVESDAVLQSETPDIRIRLNAMNYQSAATLKMESIGDGGCSPCIGASATYDLYFAPPNSAQSDGMTASFDMLNFYPDNRSDGKLLLDQAVVESAPLPLF